MQLETFGLILKKKIQKTLAKTAKNFDFFPIFVVKTAVISSWFQANHISTKG